MGLHTSKLNNKVRKVAPLQGDQVFVSPVISHGYNGLDNISSYGHLDQRSPTSEIRLPPLRETLHGRGSTVPQPICFDIPLDNGPPTSIIKRHPPRRLQKLEPMMLPSLSTVQGISSKHEGAATQEIEKTIYTPKHYSSKRQHNHKMQMQEMNRKREEKNQLQSQAEMRRSLQREAKFNKNKTRELRAKRARENVLRIKDDFLDVEHDKTFNVDHEESWSWNDAAPRIPPEHRLQGNSKLEMWFSENQGKREIFSDTSSSDSLDSWIQEDQRGHRRPPLIRTRNERIPTFDEFFDQEF
ncbi:factor associated with metabolism and energy [Discoglossus pictus]